MLVDEGEPSPSMRVSLSARIARGAMELYGGKRGQAGVFATTKAPHAERIWRRGVTARGRPVVAFVFPRCSLGATRGGRPDAPTHTGRSGSSALRAWRRPNGPRCCRTADSVSGALAEEQMARVQHREADDRGCHGSDEDD
jgi:hypothetical protein